MHRALLALIISSVLLLIGAGLYAFKATDLDPAVRSPSSDRETADVEKVRILRHRVPQTGSFEVRFADGRPSELFYWDDLPARRCGDADAGSGAGEAKAFARAEREGAGSLRQHPAFSRVMDALGEPGNDPDCLASNFSSRSGWLC